MGSEEDRARFFAWWEATGGVNTSLRAVAEQAFMCAVRLERKACVAICRDVAERYPADVFPEDGQSLDCKSDFPVGATLSGWATFIGTTSGVAIGALLGADDQAHGVVGGFLEESVVEPALNVGMHRIHEPAGTRPAAHAGDGQWRHGGRGHRRHPMCG